MSGAAAAADDVNQHNVRVIQLDARAELRVQVTLAAHSSADDTASSAAAAAGSTAAAAVGDVCWFKLISGTAEMFGTELAHVSELG